MSEKKPGKKPDLTFDQMYERLDEVGVPEKVSGQPVSRSSRAHLKELEEELRGLPNGGND